MEKERGITIIGTGNAGKQAAIELAKHNNLCVLHSVVDSQFTEPKEVFEITKLPEFKETTYVDQKYIDGLKKHTQTCLKNRKKRKKRKRR
jgi:thioredoxin reductase|tara:strand:+ start:47 stop:316 length:270 start_codon:yes stop_codon:yes gene_type:complete